MKGQIAKLLVKEDVLSIDQIKEAIEKKRETDLTLSEALVEMGYITEPELLDFLGKSFGVPVISIEDHSIDQEVLELVPREIAIENRLVPLSITGSALTVAMSDPSNLILVDELSFLTEKNIIPVVVSERSIIDMLEKYYDYSKNYADNSESDLNSGSAETNNFESLTSEDGSGALKIDEIVKELEEYKNGGTPETDLNGFEVQEEAQHKTAEETSPAEQVIPQSNVPNIGDFGEEPMGETEPEKLYEERKDDVIFSELGTNDEDSASEDKNYDISEDLFTSDSVHKDSAQEADTENQDESENDEAKEEPADPVTSSQEPISSVWAPQEPHNETQAQSEVSDATMNPPPNKPDQSVLVIDNSRTVQKLMTIALSRSGYTVSVVSDGMEALSCLNEVKPDLIFIEINLPHMDGYQVCKIIKSHGLMKRVPVVMLSGKDGLVDKMRSKMAGANGHISKPFASNELVDTAHRYTS